MARLLGSLEDWLRFLETRDVEEACTQLAQRSQQLDGVHDDVSQLVVKLFDAPTGEVADVLLIARTALAEAAGMLDSVRFRFERSERETA
jgi:hypothetical protein